MRMSLQKIISGLMRMRDFMHVVVPSAGTGFVISHSILDYYGNKPLFPEDSLTEDYKLSVQLALEGYYMHYVLESVPRLLDNGKVRWDYVATRSLFPSTFKSAVKQKLVGYTASLCNLLISVKFLL